MDRLNRLLRRVPTWVVYLAGLGPVVWLGTQVVMDALGPDPAKTMERQLGEWALRFLLASLAVSPLRRLGLNLLRFRRALGLSAFFYAALHLAVWIWPDKGLRWDEILADITRRPYILFGTAGFLAMIPLALTSTDGAIRRLGAARWSRLHRLVYPILVLAMLHFAILSRTWSVELALYLVLAAVLLGLRMRSARVFRRDSPRITHETGNKIAGKQA